jgi:hypothetical protein
MVLSTVEVTVSTIVSVMLTIRVTMTVLKTVPMLGHITGVAVVFEPEHTP